MSSYLHTIIWSIIVLTIVSVLWQDYTYYVEKDPHIVTETGDFDNFMRSGKYDNSVLYSAYISLDSVDRQFIQDLVTDCKIRHKKVRPTFKNRFKQLCKQLFLASAISVLAFSGSWGKTIRQNTFGYFMMAVV